MSMFKKKLGQRGFTLIELLVVIAIIGILSSVVLVSLNSSRAKARDAKRIADVGSIQQALALYFDSNALYPANLATLVPTYLPTAPAAPNVGESYLYTPSSDNLSFHLGATLEQVAAGTGVLASDKDCNSTTAGSCFGGTLVGPTGFSGVDPTYDITP